jgi:hypothetical protein
METVNTPEGEAKVNLLAFQVWKASVAYGIAGYVELPVSLDEFRKNYSIAKDKGEIEAFHEVRMSTGPLVVQNGGLERLTSPIARPLRVQ